MKRIVCMTITALAWIANTTPSSAQSIADVARQERARQQKIQQPATAITNSSLKPAAPAPATTPPADEDAPATPEAAQGKEPAAKPAASTTRDEKWWRQQFETARQDLKRAEDQVTVLQLELNRANRDLLQRSDIYNRENVIGAEIAELNTKMEAAQRNAQAARQKIAQLEEELRRANAPAGWAR